MAASSVRVLEHHVSTGRAKLSFAEVSKVGMDETAAARGQDYVMVFMDLPKARVLFATEGRGANTVERFAADLAAHGGDPALVLWRQTQPSGTHQGVRAPY